MKKVALLILVIFFGMISICAYYIKKNRLPSAQYVFELYVGDPIPFGIQNLEGGGVRVIDLSAAIRFDASPKLIKQIITIDLNPKVDMANNQSFLPELETDHWPVQPISTGPDFKSYIKMKDPKRVFSWVESTGDYFFKNWNLKDPKYYEWYEYSIYHLHERDKYSSVILIEKGTSNVQMFFSGASRYPAPSHWREASGENFDTIKSAKRIVEQYTINGTFDTDSFVRDFKAILLLAKNGEYVSPEAWGFLYYLVQNSIDDWQDLPQLLYDNRDNPSAYRYTGERYDCSFKFGRIIYEVIMAHPSKFETFWEKKD